jgi:hypothetical protein
MKNHVESQGCLDINMLKKIPYRRSSIKVFLWLVIILCFLKIRMKVKIFRQYFENWLTQTCHFVMSG